MTCACEHRCCTLSRRLTWLVWLFTLIGALGAQPQKRIYRSNTHYEQGDWITYTTTRFVRHLCLGDR
ncbi:hypothetical protein GX408_20990, partial [bacterium]|nr:hypothetical protein [bacterium]